MSKQGILETLVPKDPDEKRLVVITKYNTRIYQIDDLRFDITPRTHTFKYTLKDPITREVSNENGNLIKYMA